MPCKENALETCRLSPPTLKVQYGVTGGSNDGSTFVRYGAINVPLSWPLRYAHSPAELIDVGDLDSLAAVTTALANDW